MKKPDPIDYENMRDYFRDMEIYREHMENYEWSRSIVPLATVVGFVIGVIATLLICVL